MATDANTLLELTKCYQCAPPGEWELLKLGLLKQLVLANNSMADTSPAALLEATKCYQCMPPGFWQLFELGLLQQISDAGGTGGGGGVTCGNGVPVAAPSGTCGLYYDKDTNIIYQWNGAAWV